jgi:hypothetical protein
MCDHTRWCHCGNLHPNHGELYSHAIDGLPLGVLYLDDQLGFAWEVCK